LVDSTIDEDTFLENFLQNQYLKDVKIEGINDDNISEVSAENNTKLWINLFTYKIEDPTIKTIEIIPTKTVKINNKLTSQQEQKLLDVLKRNIEDFA
jgi:transcriptional/translational regulatory protein YebC/TACO1